MNESAQLARAATSLRKEVDLLSFADPVTHVYNPLDYASEVHRSYLRRFGASKKKILFLGMNPGPFGMAQTGIPFGEVAAVRDWLGLEGEVKRPDPEHPKRPVDGFACTRSEVSGRRLWGYFAERFASPEMFFADHFVTNYCPLVFIGASGRNLTPDKLPARERTSLFHACDRHLEKTLRILEPAWVVGVGTFAAARAAEVVNENKLPVEVGRILHPSPASPAANRDWAGTAEKQLLAMGLWKSHEERQ